MSTPEAQLSPTEVALRAVAQAEWNAYREAQEMARLARFGTPINHGTTTGYKRGCRKQCCRDAWSAYQREYRQRLKEKNPQPQEPVQRAVRDVKHGTNSGYVRGCRCEMCSEAHRIARPKSNVKHGSEYGYRQGCRCARCRKASREAWNRRAERRRGIPVKPRKKKIQAVKPSRVSNAERRQYYKNHPEAVPAEMHGTLKGYNYYGCRQACCRDVWSEARRLARKSV